MLIRPHLTSIISRIVGATILVSVVALLALAVARPKPVGKRLAETGPAATWADTAAGKVKLFTAGEGGDSLAQAIQQIVRPSKQDVRPILRDVRVLKLSADRIQVDLDIARDIAPGAERIHVFWQFGKDGHIRASVLPAGDVAVDRLNAYLRDRISPHLR